MRISRYFRNYNLVNDKPCDFYPTLSSTQTPSLVFQDTERWYSHRCKDVNRVLGVYFWTGCARATGLFFVYLPDSTSQLFVKESAKRCQNRF